MNTANLSNTDLKPLRPAVDALMADPARPVTAWWRLGGLIKDLRAKHFRGQWVDLFKLLAPKLIGTEGEHIYLRNQMRFAERFRNEWSLLECRRLERMGFSWRATVELLPFRGRALHLAEQGDAAGAQKITEALEEALHRVENQELDGFGAARQLQRWRVRHKSLFGAAIGHIAGGHGRQVTAAIRRIDQAVDAGVKLKELSPQDAARYRKHLAALGDLAERLRRGD